MIEINDENESMEIKETLSFVHHVLPVYEQIVDSLDDEENSKIKEYELTHEDRIEMLDYIREQYDRACYCFDEVSIFDIESVIEPAIENWITDTFDIEF